MYMENTEHHTEIRNDINSGHTATIKEDRRKYNNNLGKLVKCRAIKRYEETNIKYGKVVEEMIKNGEHMSPILSATGMSLGYFRNFIRWKGQEWTSLLAQNSKNFIKKDALMKSKKGALTMKKRHIDRINSIPEEIKNTYNTLISEGKHLAEIKRMLIERFNITEHYIDYTLVQSLEKPVRLKQSGCNNPMYGKSPSKNSGIGAKGFIIDNNGNRIHFRSSLEMKVFYFLINDNIDFVITKKRIKYIDITGTSRTYTPDIEIQNKLIEIKPSVLVEKENNKYKFEAAKKYCFLNNMIFEIYTEKHFPLQTFNKEVLDLSINSGRILVDVKNYDKIVKYL